MGRNTGGSENGTLVAVLHPATRPKDTVARVLKRCGVPHQQRRRGDGQPDLSRDTGETKTGAYNACYTTVALVHAVRVSSA